MTLNIVIAQKTSHKNDLKSDINLIGPIIFSMIKILSKIMILFYSRIFKKNKIILVIGWIWECDFKKFTNFSNFVEINILM